VVDGADAGTLGLQGEASVAGFQAMFDGRHPTTGELLGRPHGRNAVPAFDVVMRPTKSVSSLGSGDGQRVFEVGVWAWSGSLVVGERPSARRRVSGRASAGSEDEQLWAIKG
jgi:TrwC relaxase